MSDLILQRFEKLHIIKQSSRKIVQVVINRSTGQHAIAKLQQANLMKDSKIRNVLHQASFTQTLQGYRGIPFMIWSGKTKDDKIVLLVQQLGDTLQKRFQLCKYKFSAKTVCMLGIQILQIVKMVHDKGFVISNISLKTFQFGKGDKCLDLYINNLSQCMVYRDFKTMAHILQPKQYIRNPAHIFESGAVYRNQQKSRRDDIQSIFLILIYLMKGQLPWSQNFDKITSKLTAINVTTQIFMYEFEDSKKICQGLPKVFCDLLQDCRTLKFQQQPPYHWYILKLKSVLYSNSQQHDFVYDWMTIPQYNRLHSLQMKIPTIQLDKDEDLMNYLQQYIFPTIDLDEISLKYEVIRQRNKNRQQKQRVQYEQQNLRYEKSLHPNQLQLNLDEYQKNQQKKSSRMQNSNKMNSNSKQQNDNQNVLNTSILQRKKQKQEQCSLM